MNDFIFHNPDKVYFGKNQFQHLPEELLKHGKKVLLVYGGGSIKRNGLYDAIRKLAQENEIQMFELSGVEPNPVIPRSTGARPSANRRRSMWCWLPAAAPPSIAPKGSPLPP